MSHKKSIYELTEAELKAFLVENEYSSDFSATIFRNLYKNNKHILELSRNVHSALTWLCGSPSIRLPSRDEAVDLGD